MPVQMPPRGSSSEIDYHNTRMLRRAIRNVRKASSPKIEAHIVERGIGEYDVCRKRDARECRPVQVESDKLGTTGNRGKQDRAVDTRTASVQSPYPVSAVYDDGLDEDKLRGSNAISGIRLVHESGRSVEILAAQWASVIADRYRDKPCTNLGKGASVVELLSSARVNVSFPRGKQVKTRPSLLTPTPCGQGWRCTSGNACTHSWPKVEVCMDEFDRGSESAGVDVEFDLR